MSNHGARALSELRARVRVLELRLRVERADGPAPDFGFSALGKEAARLYAERSSAGCDGLLSRRVELRAELVRILGGPYQFSLVEAACETWCYHDSALHKELETRLPVGRTRRAAPEVVHFVSDIVPLCLSFGITLASGSGSQLLRVLDLISVDILGIGSGRRELQRRIGAGKTRLHDATGFRRRELQVRIEAGGPQPELIAKAWAAMPPELRASIRESVVRGLASLKTQPPPDNDP